MFSIISRSKWRIAAFVAGTLIEFLRFLSSMMVFSLCASLIWVFTFFIDIILMNYIRDDRKVKHHELAPFSFDGCEDEPFVNNIREYIALYLISDSISAEWTAETLDEMLPANRYLKFPDHFVPSSVRFAWRLWETIVQFAYQIPHDHYKQEKLVQLIVALSKRPAVLVRYRDTLLRFWDAMPHYNTFITIYGTMFFAVDWRNRNDRTHQTNLMAFLARVQATGLPYGLMFGAGWSLHNVLDANQHDELPWAALWIEHCGEYLWWFASQKGNNGPILDKRMWKHYMGKFGEIARDGRNGRYARMLAQEAFRTMARLSNSSPNPKFDNIGEQRWEAILAREGPQGMFEEPIAPDLWEEEEEEEDDQEIHEEYVVDLESEEDSNGFHPLRPPGGFLLYSDVTEEDETKIARAA